MIAFSLLAGCADARVEKPEEYVSDQQGRIREQYGTVHGDREGFVLYSTAERDANQGGGGAGPGIAVNSYLWRASLETIDFMPLAQADPFGGVIITDWYSPPETPNERFRLNVFILGEALRADGVKVTVFRQTGGEAGWQDSPADPKTATDIEDSILTRARELRVASLEAAADE
ncbi:MAG: DUF3576 domain-containing protein [Geminicoccales bacterium]